MNPWLLADDLSGALEVAAAWHAAGRPVRVVLGNPARLPAPVAGERIVGVSSETRNAVPADAEKAVQRILTTGTAHALAFKKIDSTLRGAIGTELAAVRHCLPLRPILFCPANPEVGRTVVGGRLLVNGTPVHETAFARDPTAPVTECRIRLVLESGGSPAVVEVLERAGAEGEASLERALAKAWSRAPVASVDAMTADDLVGALRAARKAAPSFLPVGSGGLGRAMIAAGMLPSVGRSEVGHVRTAQGDMLFVVGSVHPVSRRQLEQLEALTGARAEQLAVFETGFDENMMTSLAARLSQRLEGAGVAALTTDLPSASGAREPDAGGVASALGSVVEQVVARRKVATLVVTGGDVARAVFEAVGGVALELVGEAGPGIALARLETTRHPPLLVVVKPGGFGREDLFTALVRESEG